MEMNRSTQYARIALIALLILGCLFVLRPFVAAMLFAAVVCVSTWPFYNWLHKKLKGRDTLSALLMTFILIFAMLGPTIFLSIELADTVHTAIAQIRAAWADAAGGAPEWLGKIPWVGHDAVEYWNRFMGSRDELLRLLEQFNEPVRHGAISAIGIASNGIVQMAFVIFVGFFYYRDGHLIAAQLSAAAEKLGGTLGQEMLLLTQGTVTGVMVGIVGTAIAQALVALVGFLVAGVPGALLLAMATFFLSMIPVGPPLIWGGAAFWLYQQDHVGWAIFMVLYGLLVISSVDNFVKPILISRTASLPILLIALGVFGGILAFGFIGIFLGPTLLALANALFNRWATWHKPAT
jgi:predicted PurR-regulated permease PerM